MGVRTAKPDRVCFMIRKTVHYPFNSFPVIQVQSVLDELEVCPLELITFMTDEAISLRIKSQVSLASGVLTNRTGRCEV